MRFKAVAIGLSAVALAGCATGGSQSSIYYDGDQPLNEILSQYDSDKYVITSNPGALSAAEREKLEAEGYKLLKTDSVDGSSYIIQPVSNSDISTSSLKSYVTNDGMKYRILKEEKPEEIIAAAVDEQPDSGAASEEPKEEPASSLVSPEQSNDAQYSASESDTDLPADTQEPAPAEVISEIFDGPVKADQEEVVTVDITEETQPEPEPVVYEWFEGETLREALERWIDDAEYNKLVWHVLDDEGDTVEIPIAANYTFDADFEKILPMVKRAYATSPINPLYLDFTIKKGNKTLIVTNAGATQ
ncbi:TcpQ domain-containing protein [Endozoicomonas sp. ALC066]|uniref:TcpQ domain-containing protein n=1 Tax=Endozoicomonas sp. ALC066 TaxID=3403078 RepID=UPI003BB6E294